MMKNIKKRLAFAGLVIGGTMSLVAGAASPVMSQDSPTPAKQSTAKTRSDSTGRDPFKKYEPQKAVSKRAGEIGIPTIDERINMYKAQKQAAMNARVTAPKPTTAILLNEIQVIGITRTPRGYAAIVEAMPIKLSYVIYPGERFYDGQLVAIEDTRLVFRREVIFSNGKRERTVEMKPLRQPNSVNSMSTTSVSVNTEVQKNDSVAVVKP
jgi:hypothetical protein